MGTQVGWASGMPAGTDEVVFDVVLLGDVVLHERARDVDDLPTARRSHHSGRTGGAGVHALSQRGSPAVAQAAQTIRSSRDRRAPIEPRPESLWLPRCMRPHPYPQYQHPYMHIHTLIRTIRTLFRIIRTHKTASVPTYPIIRNASSQSAGAWDGAWSW